MAPWQRVLLPRENQTLGPASEPMQNEPGFSFPMGIANRQRVPIVALQVALSDSQPLGSPSIPLLQVHLSNQEPLPTLYTAGCVDEEGGWRREKDEVREAQ